MNDDIPESLVFEMKAHFGDKEADEYIVLMKAARSLIFIWKTYIDTPSGSQAERVVGQELERMLDQLLQKPEHSVGLIQSLLAIIQHMRMGGPFEDWFTSMGLDAEPQH